MSIVAAICSPPNNLLRVRDINWADPDITRAAIIPIHYDGKYRWIGFGISTFSTSIITIGGSYEDSDYDLLATAIREYNEEIGSNTAKLTEDTVANCYALKTNYSIEILLPFKKRLIDFTPTTELHNVIWFTAAQLQAIYSHQDYIFPERGNTRPYVLSGGLKQLIPSLVEAVNSGSPFTRIQNDTPFNRPKRIGREVIPRISKSIDEFGKDAEVPNNFKGHSALVAGSTLIGIMRKDHMVYILPITTLSQIISILNNLGFKVIVTGPQDYKFIVSQGLTPRIVSSFRHNIDQLMRSRIQEARSIETDFNQKLAQTRTLAEEPRILAELGLIIDYEEQSYELVQKHGIYANPKRECYLDTLKLAINMIARQPLTFDGLRGLLQSQCRDLTVTNIIITAIKTGVFIQDPRTTTISMP